MTTEATTPRSLTTDDKTVIFKALNTLAIALGGHGHQWSEDQIALWKQATRLIAESMRPHTDFDKALAEVREAANG